MIDKEKIEIAKKVFRKKTYTELSMIGTHFEPSYGAEPNREMFDIIADIMIEKLSEMK